MEDHHLLLPSLLMSKQDVTLNSSPFILVTDSLLQPGLLLLRQFISSSLASDEHVILISVEQPPSRLLPEGPQSSNLEVIDCVSSLASSFASTSTQTIDPCSAIDLYAQQGLQQLKNAVTQAITRGRAKASKLLVVFDSVDLLHEIFGVHGVHNMLQATFKSLGMKQDSTSRVLALHHHAFPTTSSNTATPSPALLPFLLSPAVSASTIHLTLHPSPLLELLSREYTLQIPLLPSTTTPIDLRLPEFLASFSNRFYGDPFRRPRSTREEDERIPIDLLGSSLTGNEPGGCVVEWTTRGVGLPTILQRNSIGGFVNGKIEKRLLVRGIEGLVREGNGVKAVGLDRVLKKEGMASINVPVLVSPNVNAMPQNPLSTAPKTSAVSSQPSKSIEVPLPFNLSLTASQESARSSVPLPFIAKEGDASMYQGLGGVGKVDYDPDEGDDMDDDDPDEDLEV